MAKLVLQHRDGTIYEDEPDRVYDFPRRYLRTVEAGVGDWAVYYEPVKAGPRGYFAVAKITGVTPKPGAEGRFLALIDPGSFLEFDRPVARLDAGRPLESALAGPDGMARAGGLSQSAVRRLPEAEFARIVDRGLPADLEGAAPRAGGYDEGAAPFERPVIERLTSRPYRDAAFRRRVLAAYGARCALSGLGLRNGGGRPEVAAAHIRPVARKGTDSVRNGLALSATLH